MIENVINFLLGSERDFKQIYNDAASKDGLMRSRLDEIATFEYCFTVEMYFLQEQLIQKSSY